MQANPTLGIAGFRYSDLYDYDRLRDLTTEFDSFLRDQEPGLFGRFEGYRSAVRSGIASGGLTPPDESALLIDLSRDLGVFLTRLFQIEADEDDAAFRTLLRGRQLSSDLKHHCCATGVVIRSAKDFPVASAEMVEVRTDHDQFVTKLWITSFQPGTDVAADDARTFDRWVVAPAAVW